MAATTTHHLDDKARAAARRDSDPAAQEEPGARATAAAVAARTAAAGAPPPGLPPTHLLALQRRAGNAAVAAYLQRGVARAPRTAPESPAAVSQTGGEPLAAGSRAHATLGEAAPLVRVHRDTPIGENPDALARTDGFDIHLAPGAPEPGTAEGDYILAHEAAHVVQQTRQGAAVGRDQAEAEADATAEGASVQLSPARGPHYFEARWHQATLTNAMAAAGFSEKESQEAYFGNWCRDLNQAFVPIARDTIGIQATMTLLQMLSQMKFGRPVPPEMIGMYEPRQHIDNPAGQVSADLIQTDTPSVKVSGGTLSGQGDLDLDPAARDREGKKIGEGGIERKMKIDGSGVPAYIGDSKGYIKEQIENVIFKKGRSETGKMGPEGLHAIGNMSHTIQDLFAHSNWVEIAVAKVIEDGTVTFPPADPKADTPEGRLAKRMQEAKRAKIPIIENFSADVVDAAGKARPILQTGTFSGGSAGHDTLISLKAEVGNLLQENNPFGAKGGGMSGRAWELTTGVLKAIEDAGNDGKLGEIVKGALVSLVESTKGAAKTALDKLPKSAREKAEGASVAGYELKKTGVGGFIRRRLGDVGELAGKGARAAGEWGVDKLDDLFNDVKPHIAEVVNRHTKGMDLVGAAEDFKKGFEKFKHAVADVKKWISDKVPETIARPIINLIDRGFDKLTAVVKGWLEKAWQKGTEALMKKLGGAKTDVAESNVAQKLKQLKDDGLTDEQRQQKLNELKDKVVAAVRKVAPGPQGEEAISKITSLPLPQAVVYLQSADFRALMINLSDQDEGSVKALREHADKMGRIQQIEDLPEWARQGASHSQVAKDHADSPFFGIAFKLANTVDTTLMALIKEAFDEMAGGTSKPAAGFEGRLDPEEAGISDAEKERRQAFQHNRDMGAFAIEHGHADELQPLLSLMKSADYLKKFMEDREKNRVRWAKEKGEKAPAPDKLPPVLNPLVAAIAKPDKKVIINVWLAAARRGTKHIATGGDWFSIKGEDWRLYNKLAPTFDRIERISEKITDACQAGESAEKHAYHGGMHKDGESAKEHAKHAGVCASGETEEEHGKHAQAKCAGETLAQHAAHAGTPCAGESTAQHLAHAGPVHAGESPEEHAAHSKKDAKTEVFYKEQIDALNKMRGKGKSGAKIAGKWASDADVRKKDREVEAIKKPKERLLAEVDRIFNHPYESNWWRPTVVSWCNANKELLVKYIDERNQGVAHHHAH